MPSYNQTEDQKRRQSKTDLARSSLYVKGYSLHNTTLGNAVKNQPHSYSNSSRDTDHNSLVIKHKSKKTEGQSDFMNHTQSADSQRAHVWNRRNDVRDLAIMKPLLEAVEYSEVKWFYACRIKSIVWRALVTPTLATVLSMGNLIRVMSSETLVSSFWEQGLVLLGTGKCH